MSASRGSLGSALVVAVLAALAGGPAATRLASSEAPPLAPSAGHQRMLALLQQLADDTGSA